MGYGLSAAAALGLPLPAPPERPFLRPARPGEPVLRFRDGPRIASAAQIVLECSRRLRLEWSLAVADAAIARRLTTHPALVEHAASAKGPGSANFCWVADHARATVESPLESLVRAVVILAGLPEPVPQQWISTARGSYRVDLLDAQNAVIIEADGKVKYTSPEDVWREKRREDALRDAGFDVVRFAMADFFHQQQWLATYCRALGRSSVDPAKWL